jgi:hypothetical protein
MSRIVHANVYWTTHILGNGDAFTVADNVEARKNGNLFSEVYLLLARLT